MSNFRPLESIVNFFKDFRAEYRAECDKKDREFRIHQKKSAYIDSLRLALSTTLNGKKTVIYNDDNVEGYYVAVGDKVVDRKSRIETVKPDLTIILESKNMEDMTFKVWNKYRNGILLQLPVKDDEEYKRAKNNICEYVMQNI